jgi:predicted ATPase/DNA-binding SARP family transcriptional activator
VLAISVLGSVAVTRDGVDVAVPSGKTSELLVRLALDAGALVRTERLVEDLWADTAVSTQRNTLQSKVSQLRKALGDSALLVGTSEGYRLDIDPECIDVHVALRDATSAQQRLDSGDLDAAVSLATTSLATFGDEPLPAAGDWAIPHRVRLEATRLALLETLLAARQRLGDPGVLADLEAAVEAHPYQERLWTLMITGLYQGGRQADALAACTRVRTLLVDELGLEPGPELRDLEHRILTHDDALATSRRTGNLPSLTPTLVGRDDDLDEIRRRVATERLVTIVGPGGVGKTAAATAVAKTLHPPGGAWLVRLETATRSEEVVDAVIAALGVIGGADALVERVRRDAAVIVLDNCEHVVDAAAALVEQLLDAGPELRIVCTSQRPLGLDAESLVELSPLTIDGSVELFVSRATRTPDDKALVEALCAALDGLPLAIELAAARTRTLTVEEIARRLDDRFQVLADPTSRKQERRRTLRATIGWSYDLLFPDDQKGLWALATFAGGAPLDAIELVMMALDVPRSAALDVIDRLVNRSLVIVDADRYRLLDSIRAFALEAIDEAGQRDVAADAHSQWLAGLAATSTEGVRSAEQAASLEVARAERANIDAALAWCATHDPERALQIATGFGWAWIVLGDSRGADRLRAALDAAGASAEPLLLMSWIEASTGDLARARDHIALAQALADDDFSQAKCLYHLAYVVSHEGDFAEAIELTARARSLYGDEGPPWDRAANALFALRAATSAADRVRAVELRGEVERCLAMVDDPWLHARGEAMLGELARLDGRFDDAVAHLERAIEVSRSRGYLQTEAYQVATLGRAQCQAGDYEAGAASLHLAVEKAEAIGDVRMAALARVHLGRVERALGHLDAARDALVSASAWHRAAGGGEQALLGECLLAAMDGDTDRLEEILATTPEPHVAVFALDALGRVDEADKQMALAAHFISERDRVDR